MIRIRTLRILVADDDENVRRAVGGLLLSHSGWEICGEAADGREAVAKARELKPEVVVLDISLPRLNGLDVTRRILRDNPQPRVLILTITESEQEVEQVLKAGARGLVLKSDVTKDLAAAVEALSNNRTFFKSQVGETVFARFLAGNCGSTRVNRLTTLTAREREIVQLLVQGQSTKEVAATLGLSAKTAETHRSNLMRKLGLRGLSELVLYAERNKIMPAGGLSTGSKLPSGSSDEAWPTRASTKRKGLS